MPAVGQFVQPCRYYVKGQCHQGVACKFAHLDANSESAVCQAIDDTLAAEEEATVYQKFKYQPPPSSEMIIFKDESSYSKSKLIPGMAQITFGTNFIVTDDHLDDLLEREDLLGGLEILIIKGSEDTVIYEPVKRRQEKKGRGGKTKASGKGKTGGIIKAADQIYITNERIVQVIRKCPHLRVIHLRACVNLTDTVLENILSSCLGIQEIVITGKELCELDLTNQPLDPRVVASSSWQRADIVIVSGLQCPDIPANSQEQTRHYTAGYVVCIEGIPLKLKDVYRPVLGECETGTYHWLSRDEAIERLRAYYNNILPEENIMRNPRLPEASTADSQDEEADEYWKVQQQKAIAAKQKTEAKKSKKKKKKLKEKRPSSQNASLGDHEDNESHDTNANPKKNTEYGPDVTGVIKMLDQYLGRQYLLSKGMPADTFIPPDEPGKHKANEA
ncbi:hypothetical protein ABW19_dt0201017 [Dactylella cylindrospora]|nr:hypothetical protein ABW19_dt0201017 [Dactylella cylindrospora]